MRIEKGRPFAPGRTNPYARTTTLDVSFGNCVLFHLRIIRPYRYFCHKHKAFKHFPARVRTPQIGADASSLINTYSHAYTRERWS